jgi:molecular chaperone DnaK
MIKESGYKMKPEDKKELEDKTAELKKVKEAGDLEGMKKQMEEINAIAQKIGAAMYQQPGAGAPGAEGAQAGAEAGAGEEKKEDVVEGEVEEKK